MYRPARGGGVLNSRVWGVGEKWFSKTLLVRLQLHVCCFNPLSRSSLRWIRCCGRCFFILQFCRLKILFRIYITKVSFVRRNIYSGFSHEKKKKIVKNRLKIKFYRFEKVTLSINTVVEVNRLKFDSNY